MSTDTARLIVRGHDDDRSKTAELKLAIGQSVLDAAHAQGIEIDHACGGVCACSTCHIKVHTGDDAFDEADDDELDQLDKARDVALNSRLSCQAKLQRLPEGGSIEIEIPAWNVNMVQEGH